MSTSIASVIYVPCHVQYLAGHTPCSATSSCSGNSGMGLLSHGTSASGGSSLLDSRPMSPSQFGQYLASPTFVRTLTFFKQLTMRSTYVEKLNLFNSNNSNTIIIKLIIWQIKTY